jgi:SPP1 gp7 family putative phage head morphogenesis protein
VAEPVSIRQIFDLPPEQAIAFLAQKGYRTTAAWPEMMHEDHSRAFTVSRVARIDILEAIRTSLDQAMRDGVPFEQWKTNLVAELVKKGWWSDSNLAPRRLRTIYDTNLRTARASALWQRVQANKELLPFLRYSAVMDRRTRPLHRAWHGTILPVDHPFWRTHFPPNGWNCRCTVIQLSQRDLDRRGWKVTDPPPPLDDLVPFFRKATGQTMMVPRGIDPGFGYNPGEDYFHALKPPPLTGPILRPMPNARGEDGPLTPLPPPRQVPDTVLLPRDMTNEQAADAFVESFNDVAEDVAGLRLFTDKLGEPLVIDRSFFMRGEEWKLTSDRRETINLLAMTLQDPDEIWWVWENVGDNAAPGGRRWRLTRRYVARFEIDGKPRTALAVMQAGKGGWRGVTSYAAKGRNYADAEQVREGVLAYRRQEE